MRALGKSCEHRCSVLRAYRVGWPVRRIAARGVVALATPRRRHHFPLPFHITHHNFTLKFLVAAYTLHICDKPTYFFTFSAAQMSRLVVTPLSTRHHHHRHHTSPFRSILFHIEGQVPLADNNGPLSACFYVMCRQAAPRQTRTMHPQTIEHLRTTLWPAPSQTVRRSQAARRRLRRRALIFRLGARAALVGPPGLAKYGTLVNVTTSGEHGLDKTDGIILRSRRRILEHAKATAPFSTTRT